MKKIGDVTSTADKNGEWTNGNVATGIAPTILEAGWLNSVQREILGVLIEAGIAQDKNNDNQLKDAIKKIISGGDYATKTEVNSKLAKDKNGADIPDKDTFIKNLSLPEKYQAKGEYAANNGSGIVASEFRSHLQLGDAARRYVGNNPNDLPDMSFFKTVSGGFSLPQGTQFRFGVISGDGYKSFNVPFPNECHTVVFGQMFGSNAWVFSAMYKNLTKSGFEFAARAYSGVNGLQTVGESVSYLAIGN